MILPGRGVAVLMYHGIGQAAPHGEAHYTFTEEDLDRHLRRISTEGRGRSYQALLSGEAPPGSVVLTFDDGERSVAERALPLMRRHGLVGALFVTTSWIGTAGYVDAEQVGLLDQEGWVVGTHGVTHRLLSDLDPAEMADELERSREDLRRILGRAPVDASLPGGRVDRRVRRAVHRAGYRSLCTSVVGTNASPPRDPRWIRRVMMLRGFDDRVLGQIVAGDPGFYLRLRLRQEALGLAKRTLGNRRYEALRARAFALKGRQKRDS